jgi:hypothetical protein
MFSPITSFSTLSITFCLLRPALVSSVNHSRSIMFHPYMFRAIILGFVANNPNNHPYYFLSFLWLTISLRDCHGFSNPRRVAGTGRWGVGAGLQITTPGKPVSVARVCQGLMGLQIVFKKNKFTITIIKSTSTIIKSTSTYQEYLVVADQVATISCMSSLFP